MNPYFNSIIEDINNNKLVINISDSNLTDEDIIKIADLIKDNNTIKVLNLNSNYKKSLSKNINRFNYHLNITQSEIMTQYKDNIINKITLKGFIYLFNSLKYNNSINTLILDNRSYKKNTYNNIYINSLSEMLLINKSISKLTLKMDNMLSDETFNKFCDALKNHNNFYTLKIYFENFKIVSYYNKFLEILTNQKYLQSLTLYSIKSNKVIDLLKNLEYIYNLKIIINDNNYLLNKSIFETLEHKEYLTKLRVYSQYYKYSIDFNSLSKLISINKNLRYLKINGHHSRSHVNDAFIQSIINSELQTLKIISCSLQIDDIISIVQNNNTINNLNVSFNNIKNGYEKLFNILIQNTNIIKLNVSGNEIKNLSDLLSLNKLIENNNCIQKMNLQDCINLENSDNLKIFDALSLNNYIHTFKISSYLILKENINDEFINKICNLIKNNKILNKLIFRDNMIILNSFYFYRNDRLIMNVLTDEYYNKINEALKYNNSLIYFGWNDLIYKEHFI